MRIQEQIKALAELDDWVQTLEPQHHIHRNSRWMGRKSGGDWMILPEYLTSYDAIIPLIQKQDEQTKIEFVGYLQGSQNGKSILESTAAELCEMLLRATGKWTGK